MNREHAIYALCAVVVVAQPVYAQGMMEMGGTYAGAAGLGAGLAGSLNHGQALIKGYNAIINAQQSAAQETQAIQHYFSVGCQYEAKKSWVNAEKCFTYVLQVAAMRDGPGSAKSVPTLQHLVAIDKAQNKINDAISYQKTVVSFQQRAQDPKALCNAQIDLTKLFLMKNDAQGAESISYQSAQTALNPAVPEPERRVARQVYATVLRKLNKSAEADAIESSLATKSPAQTPAPPKTATIAPTIYDGKVPIREPYDPTNGWANVRENSEPAAAAPVTTIIPANVEGQSEHIITAEPNGSRSPNIQGETTDNAAKATGTDGAASTTTASPTTSETMPSSPDNSKTASDRAADNAAQPASAAATPGAQPAATPDPIGTKTGNASPDAANPAASSGASSTTAASNDTPSASSGTTANMQTAPDKAGSDTATTTGFGTHGSNTASGASSNDASVSASATISPNAGGASAPSSNSEPNAASSASAPSSNSEPNAASSASTPSDSNTSTAPGANSSTDTTNGAGAAAPSTGNSSDAAPGMSGAPAPAASPPGN